MKAIFFIGQAPARPGSKHEVPGTYLHKWLQQIGLSDKQITAYCHFYALTNVFPGTGQKGHMAPTPAQIAAHRPQLVSLLRQVQPDIVVPVGKLAITSLLGATSLTDVVGKRLDTNPYSALAHPIACIPLSHPSGRSTWNATHTKLVTQALARLKEEIDA